MTCPHCNEPMRWTETLRSPWARRWYCYACHKTIIEPI